MKNILKLSALALIAVTTAAHAQDPAHATEFRKPTPGPGPDGTMQANYLAHRLGTDHSEGISLLDMNGDGFTDILSGAYWYQNPGALGGDWARHQFRTVGTHNEFVSDCGAYPTPWPLMSAAAVGALFPGPYRVPKASFSSKVVYTNTVGRAAYRGPWQFETLAREMLLDLAARDSGIDPAELRRRNLLRADELPYTSPNGMTYDSISPLETFEHALELLDYDAFRAEQTAARAGARERAFTVREQMYRGWR